MLIPTPIGSFNLFSQTSADAGRYVAFGSGNIDATAKITYDFFDGQTGEWAPSHGHLPGNPAVTSIGNVAMFANGDGSIDVIALNAKCPSNWIA